jgi:ligand-binding sensor domain-containing protein
MYNEGRYIKWDSASGMNSEVVYSLTEDAYGNIWAATLSDGLYSYNGSHCSPLAQTCSMALCFARLYLIFKMSRDKSSMIRMGYTL